MFIRLIKKSQLLSGLRKIFLKSEIECEKRPVNVIVSSKINILNVVSQYLSNLIPDKN